MDKIDALLNLIAAVIGIACFVVWVVALIFWDRTDELPCRKEDCDTCPFPCERRDKDGLP